MTRWMILAALAASVSAATTPASDELVPGAIYAQTVRSGTTITEPGKAPRGLARDEKDFAATGQILNVPNNLTAALILSNGDTVFMPNGGRLTLEEFTQEPVFDTSRDRDYEPSRSVLRLALAQGTLVISGRKPVPTSNFTVSTLLAKISCHSQAVVVQVETDRVTITVLDGVAEVTGIGADFHDSVQAGQTAVLTGAKLHSANPLTLSPTPSNLTDKATAWIATAHAAEERVVFTGTKSKLKHSLSVPQEFTQQMSADDPRYR